MNILRRVLKLKQSVLFSLNVQKFKQSYEFKVRYWVKSIVLSPAKILGIELSLSATTVDNTLNMVHRILLTVQCNLCPGI